MIISSQRSSSGEHVFASASYLNPMFLVRSSKIGNYCLVGRKGSYIVRTRIGSYIVRTRIEDMFSHWRPSQCFPTTKHEGLTRSIVQTFQFELKVNEKFFIRHNPVHFCFSLLHSPTLSVSLLVFGAITVVGDQSIYTNTKKE